MRTATRGAFLGLAVLLAGCHVANVRLAAPNRIETNRHRDEEARERGFTEQFEKQRLSPEQMETAIKGAQAFDRGVDRANLAEFAQTNAPSIWRPIGPAPLLLPADLGGAVAGFVGAVAVSPENPSVILAGTMGGLWRSADGGENFVPVSRNHEYRDCRAIAFAPSDPKTVYAGCSDYDAGGHALHAFGGFLRSSDGGGTWVKPSGGSGLPAGYPLANTKKLLVHPAVATRLYAAVTTSGGLGNLLESTDGGANWTKRFVGALTDMEFHPTSPAILYLAVTRTPDAPQTGVTGTGPGVYRSSNGGQTFTLVVPAPRTVSLELAVTPAAANDLFMFSSSRPASPPDAPLQGLINRITFNASGQPQTQTINLPASTFDEFFQIDFDPFYEVDVADPKVQYFGGYSVYKSTDGGATWRDIGSKGIHVDQHSLAWLGSDRSFIVANDGGIWKTTDAGATFKPLNNTLQVMDMGGFGLHPTDAEANCGGHFHNGLSFRSGKVWTFIAGGDGGSCTFDPANAGKLLVSYFGSGDLYLHDYPVDRYRNTFTFPAPKRIAAFQPLQHDGVGPRIYFADYRVWYSDNGGVGYQKTPSGDLDLTRGNTDRITALGLTRADQQVIYAGSDQGRLMVSRDSGATWTDRTAALALAVGAPANSPLLNRAIQSIVVDPNYPDTALLGIGGSGAAHVFRTNTYGASWYALTGVGASNYGAPLPDSPVYALLIDPLDNAIMYAATEMGIYRYVLGSSNWTSFGRGLPKWVATAEQSFASQHADQGGIIQLGTRGAGAFQLERQKPCEFKDLGLRGVSDTLGEDDCISPVQPSFARARRYRLSLAAGRATIRVSSNDFDPYVYALYTGGLRFVAAENDDESGSSLAARVQLNQPATYLIEVTSNDVNARGGFRIEVTGDGVLDELTFNPGYYLGKYSDLCTGFQGDPVAALNHFLFSGLDEKRQASPAFDVDYYLSNNADVAALHRGSPQGALTHWLSNGISQGRQGSREFDVKYYIANNPDVGALTRYDLRLALYHWLTVGIAEGRRGSAAVDYASQPVPSCKP